MAVWFVPALIFFHSPAFVDGAPDPRPNTVLILTDDMGYADVPGYGTDTEIPMPSLDRFAVEGIRFTDASVSGPIRVPSRMGLISGGHQARWGFIRMSMAVPSMPAFRRYD